ncbi:MAG: hemerythrin family protein, partial [Campylobacteraceae bacterium]|nr:hemerythrin family protein [Campylobacteraceae bacterium]
ILFLLNNINNAVQSNNDYSLKQNLAALKEFAKYHFDFEENILKKYGYDVEEHASKHEVVLQQLDEIEKNVIKNENYDRNELVKFLANWIENHIIQEDQQYSSYLNSKNIF